MPVNSRGQRTKTTKKKQQPKINRKKNPASKVRNKNYAERQKKPEALRSLTGIEKFIVSVM